MVNPKGGASWSKTLTEKQWVDMNNDGYPDYIYKNNDDDNIKVRYSQIGKTNLLKHVTSTLGADYWLSYKLSSSNPNCSQRYWNMDRLVVYDGFSGDGADTMITAFTYKNRYYDRYERDDYGYDSVITTEYLDNQAYREKIQRYHNNNYMFKGLLHYDLVARADGGQKYVENIYDYAGAEITSGDTIPMETAHCYGDAYPVVVKEQTKYYEGLASAQITTEKTYGYTQYGNVDTCYDKGHTSRTDDNLMAVISYNYDTDNNKYLVGLVSELKVTDGGSNLLRNRMATYTPEGSLQTLTLIGTNGNPQYSYTYDEYGNTASVTMPENANNQRMEINYRYDPVVHTYPDSVGNSFGYYSKAEYHYKWGKPTKTIDIAGNEMHYKYDAKGRVIRITTPKEMDLFAAYTIDYIYWDMQPCMNLRLADYHKNIGKYTIKYAKTKHNSCYTTSNNDIDVITFTDGLGRPIQVKKDVDIYQYGEKIVSSGWTHYDQLGRKIRQYYPVIDDFTTDINGMYEMLEYNLLLPVQYVINKTLDAIPPTTTTYDLLDRPDTITNPNGTFRTNAYGFAGSLFSTSVKDENSNTSKIYTDARQLKTSIIDPLGNTTQFIYDNMGQLTQSIDPENVSTDYAYDKLGRMATRIHPSTGQTKYYYDNASNLIMQTFSSGENMTYEYDYNRPKAIHYSDRSWNDVYYVYGAANSGNQTGKLIIQQDATGVQEFIYGNMGEVIENNHTYVTAFNSKPATFKTKWEYDSWNRVRKITYPDGENIEYTYDDGGLLQSMTGQKPGYPQTDYIRYMFYDKFEQPVIKGLGYWVDNVYDYDPFTRRLDNMRSLGNLSAIQDNKYTYDNVGNILKIEGTGMDNFTHNYTYDAAYRLTAADGNSVWSNSNVPLHYKMSVGYSPAGRIERKTMHNERLSNSYGLDVLDYDNAYTYGVNGSPYELNHIYDNSTGNINKFDWDSKGNMTTHYSNNGYNVRHLCWTEDNRLQGFMDNFNTAYYNYDASGERNMKITGKTHQTTQNGQPINIPMLDEPTLYTNGLITLNSKGYTKHYYTEGTRICSKIGGGFNGNNDILTKPDNLITSSYSNKFDTVEIAIEETFDGCMNQSVVIKYKGKLGNMIATYAPLNNYEPAFFYHSDHLGSSSYITDKTGLVTQSFAYLPYGEQWVDVSYQNPAFATTYKFSGKEKDEETGFGYFGARYYYDYLSIWLSTDPHADNYPHLSPYNYCSNNPIMKIDPDGKDEWELNSETGKISWISDKDENGKDILRNQDRSDKVNVTKGVLTKKVGGFANNEEWETNNNKEVLLIEFGTNEQEAVDVFEFLSDNVSPDDNGYVVEFSLTGYSENQFMITSSYEYGGDLFGSALIQDKSLNTFYNAHNHNNSPLPSRGVDTGVRNNVLGINKNATMEIYHNRRYLDYTNPTNYKTTGGARSKRNIK